MSLRIEPLTGAKLEAHLQDLARLRIEVFREFPYLYDGDLEYERRYLETFARAPDAMIVAAVDDTGVVGASTCAPLGAQPPDITAPFRERGDDLASYCYFGESVLRRTYRGLGLGARFFDAREAHARSLGASFAVFCAVVRADNHPKRPAQYRPLDAFWSKRGYARAEGMTCQIHWKLLGGTQETAHPMQFWKRKL
jgi:GNAT superfamily N-acetyltransferase